MKGVFIKFIEKEEIFFVIIFICIVIFYIKKNINIFCNYIFLDICIVILL